MFETYAHQRARPQNPNDTIERPIFLDLVGDVRGCAILDLGCGNADFGRDALNRGCRRYVGMEGSKSMAQSGRDTLRGTSGEIILSSIEDWDYPEEEFDLVVSRLALHYIADVEACFHNIYRTLVPGGRFVFSIGWAVRDGSLQDYHLLPSVRGDFLSKIGRHQEAASEFRRAASLTQNEREREFLLKRASEGDSLTQSP